MRATAPLKFVGQLGCVVALIGLLGCEAKSITGDSSGTIEKPTASQTAPEGSSSSSEAQPAASAQEVNLVVADEKQFQETVDKHLGKVVLVDFWATWCLSCVEHFPETVELFNEHADEGLAAVTVNFDDLASAPAVKEFLAESQAGSLDNLQSKYDGVGTEVPAAFEFEGVLPHYRLYDRSGKLRYRWDEPPADLKERVAELLAEPAAE